MRLINKVIKCTKRGDVVTIYPIGDCHIGSRGCAETKLREHIKTIANDPLGFAIGGGDIIDAIKPQDSKRFDFDTLPDWLIEGDALTTREKLNDILRQQLDRAVDILAPIQDKLLGLIEGNHEYTIRKYYNENVQGALCRRLDVPDLTDEALVRLQFIRRGRVDSLVILYIRHGYGSGRTPGAEPNKLARMLAEWEIADICFSGHTHNYDILPPKAVLYIPRRGKLPKECFCKYRWAANWGSWVLSHSVGPASYASRACYPARPMLTCKAVIRPFAVVWQHKQQMQIPHIEIRGVTL